MNMDKFLALKASEQQRVNFEMAYVDIAGGDITAGLLLSQIIYWYLPDKNGRSKTRVTYGGKKALAKNREDWFEEIRLTPKQYDRAVKKLVTLGIVTVNNSMFNGMRTPFIVLNEETFMDLYEKELAKTTGQCKNMGAVLTKGKDRSCPKVKIGNDQRSRPLTDTTTEITSEIKGHEKGGLSATTDTLLNKTVNKAISYYMEKYELHTGKEHPRLKGRQWEKIQLDLRAFGEDYGTELGWWCAIIDHHFERNMKTDYNINHFACHGVLSNILLEIDPFELFDQ